MASGNLPKKSVRKTKIRKPRESLAARILLGLSLPGSTSWCSHAVHTLCARHRRFGCRARRGCSPRIRVAVFNFAPGSSHERPGARDAPGSARSRQHRFGAGRTRDLICRGSALTHDGAASIPGGGDSGGVAGTRGCSPRRWCARSHSVPRAAARDTTCECELGLGRACTRAAQCALDTAAVRSYGGPHVQLLDAPPRPHAPPSPRGHVRGAAPRTRRCRAQPASGWRRVQASLLH